jgi:hypothetical protein
MHACAYQVGRRPSARVTEICIYQVSPYDSSTYNGIVVRARPSRSVMVIFSLLHPSHQTHFAASKGNFFFATLICSGVTLLSYLSVFSGIPYIPFVYKMVSVPWLGKLDNRTMVVKDEVLCCSIGEASFNVVILKQRKCDVLKYPESIVTASPDNRPSHTPSFLQACTLFAFILQYIVYSDEPASKPHACPCVSLGIEWSVVISLFNTFN